MRFYLGSPEPSWLARPEFADIPLFVSHTRLRRLKHKLPKAVGQWSLDSGGFTELDRHHGWQTTVPEYVEAVDRYHREIGGLHWASPMDWMVEPWMVEKTGLSVKRHQELTIENFLELRRVAPHLPFIPVLQGWERDDYWRHIEMYLSAGLDLRRAPLVGVGSVCRRQHTSEAAAIFADLAGHGLKIHGYGVKVQGFQRYREHLVSSDSMAWSQRARRRERDAVRDGFPELGALDGCTHRACNYCPKFALLWREAVLAGRPTP